jgi:Protein of unknown function (DUF3047)
VQRTGGEASHQGWCRRRPRFAAWRAGLLALPRAAWLALALLAAAAHAGEPAAEGSASSTAAAAAATSTSTAAAPAAPPAAPPANARPALPNAESLGLTEEKFDLHKFQVVERSSGPVSYYRVIEDPQGPFLRGVYRPPLETVTLGFELPEHLRRISKKLRWRWRVTVLPKLADECASGKTDSAAVLYVTWKRGLRWYSLKYVWSTVGKVGNVCGQRRNMFVAQDTIIRQSGPPIGIWYDEEIDLDKEFRDHFEGGDSKAEVPDFAGFGVMCDGDQTQSVSAADFAGFSVLH